MNFKRITSDPPLTPYAPQWDYALGKASFTNINLDVLAQTCLEREKEIKKLPVVYYGDYRSVKNVNDGNTGLGKNSTTSRYQSYNVLEWKTPETNQLKSNIAKSLMEYSSYFKNDIPEIWITCWVNILRWGQRITPHVHATGPNSYLSGHFNVQTGDTSTCYMSLINHLTCSNVVDYPNIPGEMTLFPSYLHHYTTRHYSFKPRITIAFDLNVSHARQDFNSTILL